MLIVRRLDDRLSERFGWATTDDIMNAIDKSPTLPSSKEARERISQAMLESRHDYTTGRAGHSLHITKHERRRNGVSLTSTTAGDDHRSVRPDQLRQSLWCVEVNGFIILAHCRLPYYWEGIKILLRGQLLQK